MISERNNLLCIVRSHSEIKDGCGLNHEGCYTVFSAPSKAKSILGGVMVVEGKHLTKQGVVFHECTEEEKAKWTSPSRYILNLPLPRRP